MSPPTTYPRIDIIELWSQLNDNLIKLVDYVPEDKVNWSPKPELWNFRGILLHIAGARDGWMGEEVRDGDPAASVYEATRSKAEIQHVLQRTWERVLRFLSDPAKLDGIYDRTWAAGQTERFTGHSIAFHLLEHDIHHRANIIDYLALLGIETPEVGTVSPGWLEVQGSRLGTRTDA